MATDPLSVFRSYMQRDPFLARQYLIQNPSVFQNNQLAIAKEFFPNTQPGTMNEWATQGNSGFNNFLNQYDAGGSGWRVLQPSEAAMLRSGGGITTPGNFSGGKSTSKVGKPVATPYQVSGPPPTPWTNPGPTNSPIASPLAMLQSLGRIGFVPGFQNYQVPTSGQIPGQPPQTGNYFGNTPVNGGYSPGPTWGAWNPGGFNGTPTAPGTSAPPATYGGPNAQPPTGVPPQNPPTTPPPMSGGAAPIARPKTGILKDSDGEWREAYDASQAAQAASNQNQTSSEGESNNGDGGPSAGWTVWQPGPFQHPGFSLQYGGLQAPFPDQGHQIASAMSGFDIFRPMSWSQQPMSPSPGLQRFALSPSVMQSPVGFAGNPFSMAAFGGKT